MVGTPKVNDPYAVSLDVTTDFEKLEKNLNLILNAHFLFGELKKNGQSNHWYGKFTTIVRFDKPYEYIAAIEVREVEEKLSTRMLFYRKDSFLVPMRIVRDLNCELLGYEVAESLMRKLQAVPSSKANDSEELYNFALDHTRNRLQGWVDRNWPKFHMKVYIAVVGLLAVSLIYYFKDDIMEYLVPYTYTLEKVIIVLAAIVTIVVGVRKVVKWINERKL